MVRRLVAALAIALAPSMGCGLQFDRFDPVDGSSDGSAQSDDGAMDAVAQAETSLGDTGSDVTPVPDAGPADVAEAGSTDGPTCGASGEPCCPGHMCQQGLVCRGSTCHP